MGAEVPANAAAATPKVLVVLSDGTGNSAAKLFKTNVWRLYQALDLASPSAADIAGGAVRQVAYYDDGVGTSSFKPLAILGGAFGWGLKRNVLDLYMFLCRNYRPGDRIFAFGFSRGAFTIRILAAVVATQGLLDCPTERLLERGARDVYRSYRRERFTKTGRHVAVLRKLRDAALTAGHRMQRQDGNPLIVEVKEIAFVGVWDTVSAYGLPVAELTRGIDKWVWPLSMPNYALSPKVQVARHALALDDERDTFHPLIWDEVAEQKEIDKGEVKDGRLQQVWFSGMHSDVGGGYPNDSLAYVSLDWMMGEAAAAGLRFRRDTVDEVRRTLDPFGPMHDSRRGLAGYYRYQPRKIGAKLDPPDPTTLIMQDPDAKMRGLLTEVKIHESVLNRIQSGQDRYAPNVLPGNYRVVMANGSVAPAPESPADARARSDGQQWVWNDTWRKRINYFTTVGVSLFLALLPIVDALFPPAACVGPQCLLAPVITGIGGVLPGFLQPWIESFAARPGLFAVVAIVIALLLFRGASLQTRIQDGMRQRWRTSLRLPATQASVAQGPGLPDDWVYRLRTNRVYLSVFRSLKWQILPHAFGIVVLAGIVLAPAFILGVALRVQLAAAERSNSFCDVGREPVAADSTGRFPTRSMCWPTGWLVEKGHRYRITLTVTTPWADADIPATPAGFGSEMMPWHTRYAGLLLRRSFGDRWFQPLVKIVPPPGTGDGYVEALELERDVSAPEVYTARFGAQRTGELFIFVNDAILPWIGSPGEFYENNTGDAELRVEPVN